MGTMKFRKGIFILLYAIDKGKVEYLILKRKLHWKGWEFNKGGLKKAEKILDAIKREIKEETKTLKPLKIKKFPYSGKYKYQKELPDRDSYVGQTFSLYAVEVKKKKVRADGFEHSKALWTDYKTALKKLTWPNQRKSLRIVNKCISKKFK
jgi:8-oxo-dGTP pyrophosphatase MutT (NUDIX family)